MLKTIILVGSGGFIGSVARYFISKLNLHVYFFSIPVGTLIVNVLGSLIIGFLAGIADKSPLMTLELRLLLMAGFCGGFTTFSTFSNENLMLMQNGQYGIVFLYTGLSILLGFSAAFGGYTASSLL